MKIGAVAAAFASEPLEAMLDRMVEVGVEAVEIGAGGYARTSHCPTQELLADEAKLRRFAQAFEMRGLIISALNSAGNPVHPNEALRTQHRVDLKNAILLAERLGFEHIVVMSGCPGGSEDDRTPNWPVVAWPDDFPALLQWQWREKLIPYWIELAAFAREHGVTKLAFELHPGMSVYNYETWSRLQEAVGPEIGVNLDPSHFFWQGIDPLCIVRQLGPAIFHVHIKDHQIDPDNVALNGVLDTKPFSIPEVRSWVFRVPGYGHDQTFWKQFISGLRQVGFDGTLNLEHEDPLIPAVEGLSKGVEFLRQILSGQH